MYIKFFLSFSLMVISCKHKPLIQNYDKINITEPFYIEKFKDLKDVNTSSRAIDDYILNLFGDTISLNEISKKKYIFIKLWATWCEPCLKTMPDFIEKMKKYKNIEFVAISIDLESQDWIKKVAKFSSSKNQYWVGSSETNNLYKLTYEIMKIDDNMGVISILPNYIVLDENWKLFKNFDSNDSIKSSIDKFLNQIN